MTRDGHATRECIATPDFEARPAGGEPPVGDWRLSCTLVRYLDGPDRCTIAPTDAPPAQQLTAWLTVNHGIVADLGEWR